MEEKEEKEDTEDEDSDAEVIESYPSLGESIAELQMGLTTILSRLDWQDEMLAQQQLILSQI